MFRREMAAGARCAEVRGAIEDAPFFVKLFARGEVGIAGNDVLLRYRHHANNFSRDARFFSNGIRLLRRMDRAGEFAGLTATQQEDKRAYFAFIAHLAIARHFGAGERALAMRTYVREWPSLVRFGRWRIVAAAPLMAVAPRRLIQRRWAPHPG